MARQSAVGHSTTDERALRFGRKLVELRRNGGFESAMQIVTKGLSASTISRYESGKSVPSPDKLAIFCDQIGVRLDALEPELSDAYPHVAVALFRRREEGDGWHLVDERGAYFTDHTIHTVYVDVAYTIGPNKIPELWREVHVFRPHTPDLRVVVEGYLFTGDRGCETLEVVRGGKERDGTRVTGADNQTEYLIDLDRTPEVGQTHLLEFRVMFDGCRLPPEPWFAYTPLRAPKVGADRTTLRLRFHPDCLPTEVVPAEGTSHSLDRPIRVGIPLPLAPDGYYERSITDPLPHRSYGFSWKW